MDSITNVYNSIKKNISDIFIPNDGRTEEKFILIETSNIQLNNILNTILGILIFGFFLLILFLVLYQIYHSIKFCFENPLDPICRKQFKVRITHGRSRKRYHSHRGHHGHRGYYSY